MEIDSPFTMVVLIVMIVMIASVIRAAVGGKRSRRHNEAAAVDDAETRRLRDEVKQLKDRLANVERIVTDDSHRLTQEIESLRVPRN